MGRGMITTGILLAVAAGSFTAAVHWVNLGIPQQQESQAWRQRIQRAGLINASPQQVMAYLHREHLRFQPEPGIEQSGIVEIDVPTKPGLYFDVNHGFFRHSQSVSLIFAHYQLFDCEVGPS